MQIAEQEIRPFLMTGSDTVLRIFRIEGIVALIPVKMGNINRLITSHSCSICNEYNSRSFLGTFCQIGKTKIRIYESGIFE